MDIPIVQMITRASAVARIVLILLLIFSVVSWAIIFNRFAYIRWAKKMHRLFIAKLSGLSTVADIDKIDGKMLTSPLGQVGKAGAAEYARILRDSHSHTGVKDWSFFLQNQFAMASEKLQTEMGASVTKLDKGVFMLAIISSSAPFIGLLGTVWGIMDAFFEIGQQGSASLPVVAPGIAEALIATAVALAVAVPSVFFFNWFNHSIERIEEEMTEQKDTMLLRIKQEILNLLYGNKNRANSVGAGV
jgi:biopolymer transport protein TolQ